MTDHPPSDEKKIRSGTDRSKRSGASSGEKDEKATKSSKSDKKEKKSSSSSSSNKKSSSKSKLSRSGTSTGSKSKSKSSSSINNSKSSSSASKGKEGKEGTKESQSKEKKKPSSSSRDKAKEKEKSSKKDKNGSSTSLKKEVKKASKSSKKDKDKERSKEKEKEKDKASKDKEKSQKSSSSSKPKQKYADSKTSDSSKENTEKAQKKGKSPRRVSFDNNSLSSHSSQNSLDISGDISSGSGESFHLSDDDEGSASRNSYDNSDLHASAIALPSVALKALQAMAALKKVEPANFKADQKKDPSYCESPSSYGNSSRRASVSQADMTALSPLVGGKTGQAAAGSGMDWGKLNRRLTYKHIKKPETKLETEKRMASEQTGKFFQLIQQQQQGSDADDPNLKLLTSAVEHRAKNPNFPPATAEPQKRIPRSARIKKHQQPTQDNDLDTSSTSSSTKKLPPRVKSADPRLGRSLSALGGNRVRRNKSSDSYSQLSFESKGSKGSKGSLGSSKKSLPKDGSGRSMEESRSSHGDRAVRRKQQREAFHKSFSSHEHMRPSARRKKKAEDMTRSLNMSLSSGMNARVRRHKSEEDYSFATSASSQSRDRGGIRRNKTLEEESPIRNNSRAARKKLASSTNTRGISASARLSGDEDDDLAMDASFDEDMLALKDYDDGDDFRAMVQQTDEFVSIHDLVKKDGKQKRFSIWD